MSSSNSQLIFLEGEFIKLVNPLNTSHNIGVNKKVIYTCFSDVVPTLDSLIHINKAIYKVINVLYSYPLDSNIVNIYIRIELFKKLTE